MDRSAGPARRGRGWPVAGVGNEFEDLLVLVSVLVGVALSDLAMSLHRLLRDRHRVRWDWLSPAAAALATLMIVRFWWKFYRFGQAEIWSHFGPFLVLLLQLLQLVLLACAALPDEGGGQDLREYYQIQARYFWWLFSSYALGAVAFNWLSSAAAPLQVRLFDLATNLLIAAAFAGLGCLRQRWIHALVVPLACLFFLVMFLPQELA
ncbi:MAG: hypothetical protein VKK62_00765 [Synechococcaceae cyanobacterium]|nr:hypothetical protein [Synechococcaceae cyanobacterium]